MNRTDRLYAIVEELRARAPRVLSATELARRFEVSVRTIERDLLALQESGVPIWAQTGRNGGYALDPRRTLPPVNFTAEEATAIATALATSHRMPFAASGRSAMRKLVAAMAAVDSDAATDLAARVWVTWPERPSGRADVLSAVEAAVAQRRVVRIGYTDRGGKVTDRLVEAHGVAGGPGSWYLVGWCLTRDEARTFKLNRVMWANLTTQKAPTRDLEGMLDWAGAHGRSAADLIDPESMPADLIQRMRRHRSEFRRAWDSVPMSRWKEAGACGEEWSPHDVLNHVNAHARRRLFHLLWALTNVEPTEADLNGDRDYVEPDGGGYDRRNAVLTDAGRALSTQSLVEEEAWIFERIDAFAASLPARQLDDLVGWVPYWDRTHQQADPRRLVRRLSDVAGLSSVTTVAEWLGAAYTHHLEHGKGLERWARG